MTPDKEHAPALMQQAADEAVLPPTGLTPQNACNSLRFYADWFDTGKTQRWDLASHLLTSAADIIATLTAPTYEQGVAAGLEMAAKVKEFAREIIEVTVFHGADISGDSVQELAEMYGLIQTVAYDPDQHGATEYPVDAGDDWYVFTSAIRALADQHKPSPAEEPMP